MSDIQTWYVDDQNPSISQLVSIDGTPVALDDLGATVTFKMRLVGADADSVSATAVIVESESGLAADRGWVRYDWTTNDLEVAGTYVVRWTVDLAGELQTTRESVIQVLEASALPSRYISLEEMKVTLELQNLSYADPDLRDSLAAASRMVEDHCRRRFWLDAANTSERYFAAYSYRSLWIDDCVDIASVEVDAGGDWTFSETRTENTDYLASPVNALEDGRPYTELVARARGWTNQYVKVTGQFGWPAVPEEVREATKILATNLFKRKREAPFGIVTAGAEAGVLMRLQQSDPHVAAMLRNFVKVHAPL